MKNRIITISFREIKKSYKRFLSLLIMSFLGVAVFVGLRSSDKVMLYSLDKYYDNNNVYDIKIVSTLGLTDSDIDALKKLDLTDEIYGIHSKDVYYLTEEKSYVLKISSINENINIINLVDGRLPKDNTEIVVEEYFLKQNNVNIGDKITIEDKDNNIVNKELTIVGTTASPIYLIVGSPSLMRGTTNIGSGQVNFYSYALDTLYDMPYYSEIYLTVKDAKNYITNEKEYNDLINYTIGEISIIKEIREKARYDEIYNQIMNEINENEAKGKQELSDAEQQLNSYQEELKRGYSELYSNKLKIENGKKELNDSLEKLNNAKAQIDNANNTLAQSRQELNNAKNEINEKLSKYNLSLDDIYIMIDLFTGQEVSKENFKNLVNKDNPYKQDIYDFIDYIYEHNCKDKIDNFIKTGLEMYRRALIELIPKDMKNHDKIVEFIESINVSEIRTKILKDILDNRPVKELKKLVPTNLPCHDRIINYLDKYAESTKNIRLLFKSAIEIRDGERIVSEKEEELKRAKQEYNEAYDLYLKYKNELSLGEQKLNNGYNTYYDNLNLYNTKVDEFNEGRLDFEKKIEEAKKDINTLEVPTWYIYSRNDNSDYSSYMNVGESLRRLATVFPIIFFVVAIFMSIMSMSRMALEDRSEIGCLKALGFSNIHIITKYVLYASLATILGGILGSIFGFYFLTYFIYRMYRILYVVLEFKYQHDLIHVFIGILVAFICITGTAILTVKSMVKEKTSDLLRPKAPIAGKKIFLEKIKLWNRVKFSNKVTVRNVFRYKKRVIMTVIGITGCTILLLSGYGIRDSITTIPEKQFSEVMTFNDMVYLDGNQDNLDELFNYSSIKNRLDVDYLQVNIGSITVNLTVVEDLENITNVIHLHSSVTGYKTSIIPNKVVISEKIAKIEKVGIGDTIKFTDNNNNEYEFEISDIDTNYIGHHIYMDRATYEKYIGEYKVNVSYLNFSDLDAESEVTEKIMKDDHVLLIVNTNYTKETVNNMLQSLNSIVILLTVFSGLLAFVVLYNLSYINISERKREVASLKVLGFYNKEVDNYIIKENIIITILGIIIGILIGKVFVDYIVNSIEIDLVKFIHEIELFSYIKTGLFMLLFTIIVSIIIHFSLKKVDMIESLKSVE